MELIKLRDSDIKEFKKLMQEAFQYGYESFCGEDKEQVLPEKDIDDDLKKKNSFAYEMIDNDDIVGGVIVTIDTNPEETSYLGKGGKEVKVSKKYKDSIDEFMGA